MDAAAFALTVVVISASGVMSPGPLFAANIAYGIRGGLWSGVRMAAGHAAVELPLIVALGTGALALEGTPHFRAAAGLLGAAGLFAFAALQARSAARGAGVAGMRHGGPVMAGAALSGLNPFFLAWWLSVGFKLVADSEALWPGWGMLAMFGLHIWMDFAWMAAIGWLASRGKKHFVGRAYKALVLGLSAVMVYYGITFAVDSIGALS